MRTVVSLTLITVALAAPAAAQQQYQFTMISSGPNRPGIPLWNQHFRQILVGLHTGAPSLATSAGLSEAQLAAALDSLRREGAVVERDGRLHPTCMVVTAEEGASLSALAKRVARQAVPFMRAAVARLRGKYREIAGLRPLGFQDVSFFLASDVLLDNWQINAVERQWLHAERPLRGKSRYYCALLARTDADHEPFGIYGNQMAGLSDGRLLGVYGNRRGSGHDLNSLSRSHLAELLGAPGTVGRSVLLGRVLDNLQRWVTDSTAFQPPPTLVSGLAAMGMVRDGRPMFAVLDTADDRRLDGWAGSVTDSLVAHLERATPQLRAAWTAGRWHDETTFGEFRIWWYHFFYTALTDQLAADGSIRIPANGLFHYLVVR